ncbi:hypothetical protein P7E02_05180 [Enterococcus hulanensis]|uniref:hypothetical protein n=1 Tax=Enterococcus hulanensis TaxID=2559929 RepID=UPI0028922382|nr:hypothetical protein [Enterococcus hulanensis]MDT2659249.1 hypothetical protein [Enterococcus hulanensis]
MINYIFPHPKRVKYHIPLSELKKISNAGAYATDLYVYAERFNKIGNQDPYVWNEQFLNTYCKKPWNRKNWEKVDKIFWISKLNDSFVCDLVFVVKKGSIHQWDEYNKIERNHPMIDSGFAYKDHYCWPERGEHVFNCKVKRVTLKADMETSFQPQIADGKLVDVTDILKKEWIEKLNRRSYGNNIIRIDQESADMLYKSIIEKSGSYAIKGNQLAPVRSIMKPEYEMSW